MLPLHDNIPSRTIPIVTYALLAITSLAFLVQAAADNTGEARVAERLGMVPARVLHPDQEHLVPVPTEFQGRLVLAEKPLPAAWLPDWLTPLTCVFLHGSLMHLLGNMWFLYIFGDNVEDRLGHVGYLIFYLAAGCAASLAHLVTNAESTIPTVGASGAIAGVMGAYMLLYPRAVVLSLVPLGPIIQTMAIPAPFFLGIWFLLQVVSGVASTAEVAGVAWWAHIGGFALGFVVAAALRAIGETRPPVEERRFANQWGRVERQRRYRDKFWN